MSSTSVSERAPLLPSQPVPENNAPTPQPPPKPQRTVTFNPTVKSLSPTRLASLKSSSPPLSLNTSDSRVTAHGVGQPILASLNSKIKRRNSHGPSNMLPLVAAPKIGPQRTTRTAQKLKLLPDPEQELGQSEEIGHDVYTQFKHIKDPSARRDAARLGKADRKRLPRVTAYCTASSYRMDDMMRYLKGRSWDKSTMPKRIDECIYTPYRSGKSLVSSTALPFTDGHSLQRRNSDSIIGLDDRHRNMRKSSEESENGISSPVMSNTPDIPENNIGLDTNVEIPEIFLFEYGAVVIWGMTVSEEKRFLKEIAKFEVEKLSKDDIQIEDFNFYYTKEYQARIYNDFISLREKKSSMTKLAISHALAQSVKTSLYEDLVDETIERTKEIPSQIASTGKVRLNRRQINMQIGELFILRINIHLQGSVLDSPELMWAEPQLEPVYQAVRSYLEMDQRVGLLTERLDVIADLLTVLKDQLTHTHGEYLEWVVIVLIAAEILVAAINIVVDLYAGID